MEDLYLKAQQFGVEQGTRPGEKMSIGYWTAWYAARQAAGALLVEAVLIGVPEPMVEQLRAKAAEVAYD